MTQDKSQNVQFLLPGILVNHSVKLGSAEARKMTATSGRTSLKLLHTKDPLGAFSKMFMVTSPWASTKCYLTWKPKATPQGRLLFQLAVSMPRTKETDCGSSPEMWPTPRACTAMAAENIHNRVNDKNPNLETVVARSMWPTPTANEDAAGTPSGKMQKMLGNHPDIRGTTPEEWKRGSLNPEWVEWLMGYPEGWTDLKD